MNRWRNWALNWATWCVSQVELERKDDVLWLPPQAIRMFEGRRFVVLKEDDVQRRVDVKVGIETQERVEIEEGLEEGQVVIGQ